MLNQIVDEINLVNIMINMNNYLNRHNKIKLVLINIIHRKSNKINLKKKFNKKNVFLLMDKILMISLFKKQII